MSLKVEPNSFIAFQIKQIDGSFRFVLAENIEDAKKALKSNEKIVAGEYLEQILGGEIEIVKRIK